MTIRAYASAVFILTLFTTSSYPATFIKEVSVPFHVNKVVSSNDNKFLATCSAKNVHIWNPAKLEIITTLQHPEAVTELIFAPHDSNLILVGAGKAAYLWNLTSTQKSPTTNTASSNTKQSEKDSKEAEAQHKAPEAECIGQFKHEAPIDHITFSPQGTYIATTSSDGKIKLWNTKTQQQCNQTYQGAVADMSYLQPVAFSFDESMVAYIHDQNSFEIRSTADDQVVAQTAHDGISYLNFCQLADGPKLVTASRVNCTIGQLDFAKSEFNIFNPLESNKENSPLDQFMVPQLSLIGSISGYGKYFCFVTAKLSDVTSEKTGICIDWKTGESTETTITHEQLGTTSLKPKMLSVSASCKYNPHLHAEALFDGTIAIWDLAQQTITSRLEVPGGSPACTLTFSSNGKFLVAHYLKSTGSAVAKPSNALALWSL